MINVLVLLLRLYIILFMKDFKILSFFLWVEIIIIKVIKDMKL